MDKKNLYMFILKLALTFRLSLKNLCKLLGRETTFEEQIRTYNEIEMYFGENLDLKRAYDYLFNYETNSEVGKLSNRALGTVSIFLIKYQEACKSGNKDAILKMNSDLNKIDRSFGELKTKIESPYVTSDEALIISKYRLKYAISRKSICDILGISYKSLVLREEKMSDEVLKYKLGILSDFCQDMFLIKRNVK